MSPIATSAARMVRASATPLRAAAVRQYSAAAGESSAAPTALHSTKKLAIVSGVAFVAGVDVTYAYFTLGQKTTNTPDVESTPRPFKPNIKRQVPPPLSSSSPLPAPVPAPAPSPPPLQGHLAPRPDNEGSSLTEVPTTRMPQD
ncbi:hypothetical protein BGZ47_006599 [Haplosporangium gracile]|nr:hypothetical protein BGZ47_006599 [Haplosporangium gracile]